MPHIGICQLEFLSFRELRDHVPNVFVAETRGKLENLVVDHLNLL